MITKREEEDIVTSKTVGDGNVQQVNYFDFLNTSIFITPDRATLRIFLNATSAA